MSNNTRNLIGLTAILAALLAGCSSAGPGVNVIADDSTPRSEWTTPSEEGIRAAGHASAVRRRNWEPTEAPYEREGVPHYPLWWEDPFEDKGDGNDTQCWSCADLVAMPYSMARFFLNTACSPASMIVVPPGTPMISDGHLSKQLLGYDHDAIPEKSWPVSLPIAHAADATTTQPAN